jgi:hypothetical protein
VTDVEGWEVLERQYGRKLRDEEKVEIVHRLHAFFSTVGEVYEQNRKYFDGFRDGIRREQVRSAKQLSRKQKL